MSSASAKTVLVPLVLAATWATAQADNFIVNVTPGAGHSLANVEIFSAATTTSSNGGTTAQSSQALTPSLGSVNGGTTYSTTVSTSYGTSTSTAGDVEGTDAAFGLLATSSGLLVLGGSDATAASSYSTQYGPAVTQQQALAGVQSGSLSVASALFPNQSANTLLSAADVTGTTTGRFFSFDTNGNASQIGTWSVSAAAAPVPEPASLAAVGIGALALVRRRRKLA